MLHADRQVSMASTPIGRDLDRPLQARRPGLAPHTPATTPSPPPVEGEPEEVEGGWTFPASLTRRRSPERQEAGLVRVQGQYEARHPLVQQRQHALRVVASFEADDEVIGIPDQDRAAAKQRQHDLFERKRPEAFCSARWRCRGGAGRSRGSADPAPQCFQAADCGPNSSFQRSGVSSSTRLAGCVATRTRTSRR